MFEIYGNNTLYQNCDTFYNTPMHNNGCVDKNIPDTQELHEVFNTHLSKNVVFIRNWCVLKTFGIPIL